MQGGPGQAERFFAPLGWDVSAVPVPLDPEFAEWGDSRYVTLTLTGTLRLADALNQLYVLLPVLDDAKHYWLAPDEVDKLIRAGRAGSPRTPTGAPSRAATSPTGAGSSVPRWAVSPTPRTRPKRNSTPCRSKRRRAQRGLGAGGEGRFARGTPSPGGRACAARRERPARHRPWLRLGKLLARLLKDDFFSEISGTDVSHRALSHAWRRLRWDDRPRRENDRVRDVFQGALTYADERFGGYEAAVLMEVIEHIDPPRLGAVERVVFGHAAPRVVIVTTPNAEHNVRYEGLAPGAMRHSDHRFEWTRAEFRAWADRVAAAHGYRVRHVPVGDDDPEVGAPTQMGVFTR